MHVNTTAHCGARTKISMVGACYDTKMVDANHVLYQDDESRKRGLVFEFT